MEYNQEPTQPQQPQQPVYLRPAEPPPQRASLGKRILTAFVALLFIMSVMLNFTLMMMLAVESELSAGPRALKEVYVSGDKEAPRKIVMIPIDGVIFRDESGYGNSGAYSFAMKAIKKAGKDKKVSVVILEVNSPGGGVGASDELHHEISKLAKNKSVIVHFKDIAASGGYYISAPAQKIIAAPTAITGSIGVRISGINIMGLAEKVGIKMTPITSGQHKDILSPWREMTDTERTMLTSIVMELHQKFRKVILDGRGDRLTERELNKLDDGRIFTAKQALEGKLVDAIGYTEDAIAAAAEMGNLGSDAHVVRYRRQVPLLKALLSSKAAAGSNFSLELMKNLTGREPFLYMWMMPTGALSR